MKLFVVTCIKEHQDQVAAIFKTAGIKVFSAAAVVGFTASQSQDMLGQWFAAGEEAVDSVMLFSFTPGEIATAGIELIKNYNEESGTNFPVRAFIVPVEQSSY